jgi:phosphate starvation-inducible protein PhoH
MAKRAKNTAKNNRQQTRERTQDPTKNHFELKKIEPLTENQETAFESYEDGKNVILHGYAGTGKTYISLFLALEEVLSGFSNYDKIVIVRSVVPSRDIGFLPGSIKEKIQVYEEPYREICNDLFGRGDGYDVLKMKGLVHFTTTSFLRGLTFNNAIVIVDELQNMTFPELDTVMTRMGNQSKIMFCGDFRQTDLASDKDKSGIVHFMNITKKMDSFDYVEFGKQDIVRSGLVKEYIIKRTEMEDKAA